MPKRKLFSRKKNGKRRKFLRRARVARWRAPKLIPSKKVLPFKYSTTVTLNPGATAAVPATHTFSCNGLYDPDITGVGHQPMGFDQYVGVFYDHYVVIKAQITATFCTTGTLASTSTARVGIAIRDSSGYTGDIDNLIEQGRTTYRTISPLGSSNRVVIKYNINPNKFLGRSKPLSDSQLKGGVSSNPTEQCYFILWAGQNDGASDVLPIQCNVSIRYFAVLVEPKMLSGS